MSWALVTPVSFSLRAKPLGRQQGCRSSNAAANCSFSCGATRSSTSDTNSQGNCRRQCAWRRKIAALVSKTRRRNCCTSDGCVLNHSWNEAAPEGRQSISNRLGCPCNSEDKYCNVAVSTDVDGHRMSISGRWPE
eukprot:9813533-Heterocapsa_arctica.AAC.1